MNHGSGNGGGVARVELAARLDFDLGGLTIRPARRQVCTADGDCRELEPRVMQVLVALAERPGEVLSRDQLIELCWDGRIVGDDALNRCIVALRRLAKDFEPTPFRIETVARVGYTLVPGEGETGSSERAGWPRRHVLIAGGAAAAAATAAVGWRIWGRRSPQPGPQRIVVLPFSGDAESADLAEGVSIELIALLALVPGLEVVAADSAGRLAPSQRNPTGAAARLGASLALAGDMRAGDGEVAAAVRLLAAPSGTVLWSDTYRRPIGELALLQREVAVRTAQAVGIQAALPQVRGVSESAYRHYLAGRRLLAISPTGIREAMAAFELAVAEAPHFARAWSGLAAATHRVAENEAFLATPRQSRVELVGATRVAAIRRAALRAIELGEGSAEPWEVLADSASFIGRWQAADEVAIEARRRGGAPLHAFRRLGRWRDSADVLSRAARLDPLSSRVFSYLAQALSELGDDQGAMNASLTAYSLSPRSPWNAFGLLMTATFAGRQDVGRRIIEEQPELLEEAFRAYHPLDAALFRYLLGIGPRPDPRPLIERVRRDETHADGATFYLVQIGELDAAETMEPWFGPGHRPLLHVQLHRRMAPFRRRAAFWRLMRRYGLLDYWRDSGRLPDFCDEEPCQPLRAA